MEDKYKIIGPAYEVLSTLYGGKSIHDCRAAMLDEEYVKPGDNLLFAGVGYGKDAIKAANIGAKVTVVDISETMLTKFRKGLSKHPQISIRVVHSDILEFDESEQYDMVIANFFLNVFDKETMLRILRHLISLAKPNANIVIGDFTYPTGNIFSRNFKKLYWYGAMSVFWLLARNAVHSIYNYSDIMSKLGLIVKDKKYYKLIKIECFCSMIGQKQA